MYMISVIIPTYKQRGLLAQAIDSVLDQTYQDLEIIVVDDNFPNTKPREETEILMLAYSNNPKVHYIKHERNRNGAAARNTGIQASHGEYIAFLDDDDCFLQSKLSKQMDYLQNHPEYDAVYCLARIDDKDEPTIPFEGNVIIPLLMNRAKMFTPSLMFRKQALLDIDGFDESFQRHQDYELLVKFFEKGYKIGCVKERLIIIHDVGGNRLSGVKIEELKQQFLSTFDNTLNKLERIYPGVKNQIIVNNYASVFISHLSGKNYKRAMIIFYKYFWKSPCSFSSYLLYFTRRYLKMKLAK